MTIRSQSILLSIKKLCSKFQKTMKIIMDKRLCSQPKKNTILTKKITYVVVVTSSSIQKIHSLVVVEDLVVVEVVVVVEAVVGAGVTGVPVVVSNKNSSRSTALSVTSSNSIVLSSVVFSSIISISELFSDEFVIRGVAVVEIVVWDLGEMDFEVVIGTNSPITIVGCISVKVLKKSVCVFVCFMLKIIISTHKFIFIPRSAPFLPSNQDLLL